jgi:hypothetical protein
MNCAMPRVPGLLDPNRFVEWYGVIQSVRRLYRKHNHLSPNLLRPKRYLEKIQWRKLFDLDPRFAILSDKLAVRDYITVTIGPELLPPILWFGDDPDAVPLETLEPPYIVKSTHGSGHLYKVQRREDLHVPTARSIFRQWLGQCFGTEWNEPGYIPAPRQLIVEQLLIGLDGKPPLERRLFVFNGRLHVVQTTLVEDGQARHGAFHDRDWQELPWRRVSPRHPGSFPRPQRYDDLVALAEKIGTNFDHVRVDFYDAGERIWIGELTLYNWSGLGRFHPDEADFIMGSYWTIKRPALRALRAILTSRWEIPKQAAAELREQWHQAALEKTDGLWAK